MMDEPWPRQTEHHPRLQQHKQEPSLSNHSGLHPSIPLRPKSWCRSKAKTRLSWPGKMKSHQTRSRKINIVGSTKSSTVTILRIFFFSFMKKNFIAPTNQKQNPTSTIYTQARTSKQTLQALTTAYKQNKGRQTTTCLTTIKTSTTNQAERL